MADEEEAHISYPVVNLENIDVGLQSILAKCDGGTKTDIIQEIEREFTKDNLLDTREELFVCGKSRLDIALQYAGMVDKGEKTNLEMAKRTKSSSNKNIAKEIFEMYMYVIGKTKTFPRDILSKACKYIEVMKDNERDKMTILNPVIDKLKIAELSNMFRDMSMQMDVFMKERKEDKMKTVFMEQEIIELKGQINLLKGNAENGLQTSITVSPGATNATPKPYAEGLQAGGNPLKATAMVNEQPTKPTSLLMQQAAGGCGQQPTNQDHRTRDTPPRQQSGGVSHIMNPDGSHTTILHKNTSLSNSQTVKALVGQSNPQSHGYQSYQQNSRLRGIRNEKGSALYIQQIEVNDESNDDIGYMIKEHCSQHGVRVMKYRVFRFKACYDTVGCRIIVPESQEHIALDPKMWPADITCRRWKPHGDWSKERNAEREKRQKAQEDEWWSGGRSSRDNGYNGYDTSNW